MMRVVVTGMGVVSPFGVGRNVLWENLCAGRSAVREIQRFDASGYPVRIGAEVTGFNPEDFMEKKEIRKMDLFIQYGIAAVSEAVAHADLRDGTTPAERIGVLMGTGIGGVGWIEAESLTLAAKGPRRVNPFLVPAVIGNLLPGYVSIMHGFKGPNMSLATACASAIHAIGEAAWIIRRGDADAMIAGGAEACLTPLGIAAFAAMRALSARNDSPATASCPFSLSRDGFVLGEGAGAVVLESEENARRRGAQILAEVAGYGATSDAFHITAGPEDGEGPARAMEIALARGGIPLEQVGYINAHGTSTPLNDATETRAIKRVFGSLAYRIPVSSTKSMVGHALGAAGGIETVATVQSLLTGTIHPTINLTEPDPECDLDYVPEGARRADIAAALCNALGFGGTNACIALRRWEDA